MNLQDKGLGYLSVKIANTAKVSDPISVTVGVFLCSVIVPLLTVSTALNFQVSVDGINFVPLYDKSGTRYAITVDPATSHAVALDPTVFYGWNAVKFEVADAQAADRTFVVGIRSYY